MSQQLQILPYDSRWVVEFAAERDRIAQVMGDLALRIEHNCFAVLGIGWLLGSSLYARPRVQEGDNLPALFLRKVGPGRHARAQLAGADKPEQLSRLGISHRSSIESRGRPHSLQVSPVALRAVFCVRLLTGGSGRSAFSIRILVTGSGCRSIAKACLLRKRWNDDENKGKEQSGSCNFAQGPILQKDLPPQNHFTRRMGFLGRSGRPLQ